MELASTGNKRGIPLIEEVKPKVMKEKSAPQKESKRKASQKEK
jgi:hypothetical protein